MPYLACLPVGGASLANDDVMRGGGAAEIGMWRKQRSECGVNKCGEALRSSLPQIRSSTRTNDPTSFDHPPTEYLIVSSKPPTGYYVDGVTACSVSRASAGFTEYLIVSNLVHARDCLPPPHLGDTFDHPRTPNNHP